MLGMYMNEDKLQFSICISAVSPTNIIINFLLCVILRKRSSPTHDTIASNFDANQLRTLIQPTLHPTLRAVTRVGRVGGFSDKEQLRCLHLFSSKDTDDMIT